MKRYEVTFRLDVDEPGTAEAFDRAFDWARALLGRHAPRKEQVTWVGMSVVEERA